MVVVRLLCCALFLLFRYTKPVLAEMKHIHTQCIVPLNVCYFVIVQCTSIYFSDGFLHCTSCILISMYLQLKCLSKFEADTFNQALIELNLMSQLAECRINNTILVGGLCVYWCTFNICWLQRNTHLQRNKLKDRRLDLVQ